MKKLIILGYSGHAYVVLDTAVELGFQLKGYLDKNEAAKNPFNIKFLGFEKNFDFNAQRLEHFYFAATGDNQIRKKLIKHMRNSQCQELNLIHPTAFVSQNASLNSSILIGPMAVVNASAQIGSGVIINSGAIVEHEVSVGDYSHIAPGSIILGASNIEEGAFVGAGAVIKQGVRIGKNSIVGAGAVVLKDVPDEAIVVGNPAKELLK